jgi:hypothetical protein
MAADNMAVEEKKGVAPGGGIDLKNMDLASLMKDFDPAMLQDLLAEELKDPALAEMVSAKFFGSTRRSSINLRIYLCILLFYDGADVEIEKIYNDGH